MSKLESLAERLIEGTFARLFKSKGEVADDNAAPATNSTRELRLAARPNAACQWWVQGQNRQIRLGQPVVTLGRSADNDIVVDDPSLPPHFAQLRWRDGRYYLYRLADSAARPQPLTPGDKITAGGMVFTVVIGLP